MAKKIKKLYKKLVRKLPYVKEIYEEYSKNHESMPFPPGHFYNPVNNFEDININRDKIFSQTKSIEGIELNLQKQKVMLDKLKVYYDEIPFHDNKTDGSRFWFNNEFYTYSDAIFLFSLIRKFLKRSEKRC